MAMTAKAKFSGVLAAAALICGAAISQAQATPLDKLSGQSIAVGNLIFSDFSWPVFNGAGPSNIDVQGIVVTDPATGAQQAGLRFVVIQSGVPKPFSLSAKGGPHEIAFWIDYSVTDTTGQLRTIAASASALAAGQAGYQFLTDSSPSFNIARNVGLDQTLTSLEICNWFGNVCPDGQGIIQNQFGVVDPIPPFPFFTGALAASAPLFPGAATYYVQHEMDLQIANKKGTVAGTVTMQEFSALFSE
jgi:hypothetical protein